MKLSCNVIRDLLPLYAENMTSQDSSALVEEHLSSCPECSHRLDRMKNAAPIPVSSDSGGLKKIQSMMRKRWALTALTAIFLVVTLVCQGVLMLDARVFLSCEQAVDSVVVKENGDVVVLWTNYVNGSGTNWEMDTPEEVSLVAMSSLGKLLFGQRERTQIPYEERSPEFRSVCSEEDYRYQGGHTIPKGVEHIWYCDASTGVAQQLLWGEEAELPQEPLYSVNYHLAWYCGAVLVLSFLFGCMAYFLRGRKFGAVSLYLSFLFGSIGLSTAIVSGFQFVELYGEFTEHALEGLTVAPLMFLTLVFGYQLSCLVKREKIQ